MDTSEFSNGKKQGNVFAEIESLNLTGSTCDTFRVRLYGRLLFMKRLKAKYLTDPRYVSAFRKEFETGYGLEQPSLVRYLQMEEDSDGIYILTNYVDGETLDEFCRHNPNYFKRKRNIEKFTSQMLSCLSYLHSKQVLHLDMKPSNIIITRIGNDVKLIDLGFCRTDTFDDTQGHSRDFAAPEQLVQDGETDERTDIYLFGMILKTILHSPPYVYKKIIAKCTAADKKDRFQSADDIINFINVRKSFQRIAAILISAVFIISLATATMTFFVRQQKTLPNKLKTERADSLKPSAKSIAKEHEQSDKDSIFLQQKKAIKTINELKAPSKKLSREALMTKELKAGMKAIFNETLAPYANPEKDDDKTGYYSAQQVLTGEWESEKGKIINKYSDVSEETISKAYYDYGTYLLQTVVPQRMARLQAKEN